MQKEEIVNRKKFYSFLNIISSASSALSSLISIGIYKSFLNNEEWGYLTSPIFIIIFIQLFDFGLSTYTTKLHYNKIGQTKRFELLKLFTILTSMFSLLVSSIFILIKLESSIFIYCCVALICHLQIYNIYLTQISYARKKQIAANIYQIIYALLMLLLAYGSRNLLIDINAIIGLTILPNLLRALLLAKLNYFRFRLIYFSSFLMIKRYINIIRNSFITYKMNLACTIGFQLDKFIVASFLDVGELGKYYIAMQLSSGINLFSSAFTNYFMTEMLDNKQNKLEIIKKTFGLIIYVTIPLYAFIFNNIHEFIEIWLPLNSSNMVISSTSIYLSVAVILNMLTIPFYGFLVANGFEKNLIFIYTFLTVVTTPITIMMIYSLGITGAGISFLLYNLIYLAMLIITTAKKINLTNIFLLGKEIKMISLMSYSVAIIMMNQIVDAFHVSQPFNVFYNAGAYLVISIIFIYKLKIS